MSLRDVLFAAEWCAGEKLAGDERVLVLGPSPTALAERLAQRLKLGTLTCVDSSGGLAALRSARLGRCENVSTPGGSFCTMPLDEGQFDIVFADRAVWRMGLTERQSVMNRIARLLRPAGELREREPAGEGGMATDELANLARSCGLRPLRLGYRQTFSAGRVVDAVFVRSSIV